MSAKSEVKTCAILGCTHKSFTGLIYLCDTHDAAWGDSGENVRVVEAELRGVSDANPERFWFTAFNDFVRRIVAEELNSK